MPIDQSKCQARDATKLFLRGQIFRSFSEDGTKIKYHLNFSCLYHGTIPLFCYGRLGKNKYLHRHWLSKSSEQSRAGFVGCNGSKLKDLYEKSFVSLPLIAIVSPFFFFLFLPVPALQPGVVLPRKKPKRKRCI